MFGSCLPPLVYGRAHALFTLFVIAYVYWCPTHIVLCFLFVCIRLMYPMVPLSLDCSFFIATSVFSNVYGLWFTKCDKRLKIFDFAICLPDKGYSKNVVVGILLYIVCIALVVYRFILIDCSLMSNEHYISYSSDRRIL